MRITITVFLWLLSIPCKSQFSRYLIELTDKKGTPFNISTPEFYLSPESLERRKLYSISMDSTDLPITPSYLDSIKKSGKVEILSSSKWLNMVLIKTTDPIALNKISQFPFVKRRNPIGNRPAVAVQRKTPDIVFETNTPLEGNKILNTTLNYGRSGQQITIHEGEFLHNAGYTGNGVKIAVFDAGFFKYQNIAAFDSIRLNDKIKLSRDFVENTNSVNEDDAHGMYCLSILAANTPGTMIGSAPQASYYLFRTEDVASEFPVEEFYWVAAAEMADSLGIKLISSSLGYSTFDDPSLNYTYSMMNGKSTIVSKGASLAVKKGMIVMNSAGNEGNKPWKYIIAPADTEDVLAVGAVNSMKQVASFSSYGPTSDNRVKPDIASVGWNTFVISTNGLLAQGNGTSFSNPNIAGLVACLWQAFPEFNNLEIMDAVRKSSNRFNNPDTRTGYGIPNMRIAFGLLEKERNKRKAIAILKDERLKVYPNPFGEKMTLLYHEKTSGTLKLKLINLEGKTLRNWSFSTIGGEYQYFQLDGLTALRQGEYLLRFEDQKGLGTIRLQK